MDESSTSWIAILNLYEASDSSEEPLESEPYILSKEEATFIGRSKDCHIYLKPEYSNTSRYHAKVKLVESEDSTVWRIWDLESPNGTFVNNKRVEGYQQLNPGDRITLGKPKGARFIFEWRAIELTELNEIFRGKPSYDETIVPKLSELQELEELKKSSIEDIPETKLANLPIEESNLEQEEFPNYIGTNKTPSKVGLQRKSKKWINSFPIAILGLLLFLTALFLFYRIPESIEAKKSREKSLNSYIGNISQLLLDKKLSSLNSFDPDARRARESAQGQTLTTLKEIDGPAKGTLLRFLHGAKLIKIQPQKLREEWLSNKKLDSQKVVRIQNQGLMRKELMYVRGVKAQTPGSGQRPIFLANQSDVNQSIFANNRDECSDSEKNGAKSLGCALVLMFDAQSYEKPFPTPIQLSGADLTGVVLKDAPLERINLEGAYISFRDCKQSFSGNFLIDNLYKRPMYWLSQNKCSADFSGAGLQDSRLFRAVLMGANLRNAKLDHADLRQVDLRGANLTGVSWQGAILRGACYLEDDWQKYFPEKGPDGKKFNPAAAGMKAVSAKESDLNNAVLFKECKTINSSESAAK